MAGGAYSDHRSTPEEFLIATAVVTVFCGRRRVAKRYHYVLYHSSSDPSKKSNAIIKAVVASQTRNSKIKTKLKRRNEIVVANLPKEAFVKSERGVCSWLFDGQWFCGPPRGHRSTPSTVRCSQWRMSVTNHSRPGRYLKVRVHHKCIH